MTWQEVIRSFKVSKNEDKLWLDIKRMLSPAVGDRKREDLDEDVHKIYNLIRQNTDDPALIKKIDAIEYW
jgi:hypothetical protein